jgi:hypothetical protein
MVDSMATHTVYRDGCSYNVGRFRSIAVVSLETGSGLSSKVASRRRSNDEAVKEQKICRERVAGKGAESVRHVRFPDWQTTSAGEREVKKNLRRTLFKYKLHQDKELFTKAYGYIKQYY